MEEDLKPIIVNGVDVGKCEFLTKTGHCRAHMSIMGIDTNKCKCFPNCYFKQLKRKEQENEELRQYHNKCCNEENCNLLKGKEQKLVKIRQILYVYYGDDWKATREIERVLNGR